MTSSRKEGETGSPSSRLIPLIILTKGTNLPSQSALATLASRTAGSPLPRVVGGPAMEDRWDCLVIPGLRAGRAGRDRRDRQVEARLLARRFFRWE